MNKVTFIKKPIVWLWGGIGLFTLLAFLTINALSLYDYQWANGLYSTNLYTNGAKETLGFVQLTNKLYYQAFVQGKVLSLFQFNQLPFAVAMVLYTQFALLLVALYVDGSRAMTTSSKLINRGCFVLLLVSLLALNINSGGSWSSINNPQIFHIQTLYEFGYWGSVEYWISQLQWTYLAWIFAAPVFIYTLVKAHVIVTTFHTDDPKQDLKRLLTGCSMAIFAPYRLTQGFSITKDEYSEQLMLETRAKTLNSFKIKPHTAIQINKALASEETGLIGLTDLSATYIPLFLQPEKK